MEQPTEAPAAQARMSRVPWQIVAFAVVLGAYVLLTVGVIHRSPLLTLDRDVFRLDLRQRYPEWLPSVDTFVMLGQRAPATLVALPWFLWRAWKSRSSKPLVMLVTALVVLNLSVGVVKLATGRLGPRATHHVHAVFEGGDIFPSGHVSNAVVLYGVIAMLAAGFRRTAMAMAVFLSLMIGLSTIYLDTHWVTDVLGGWLAGALVLIVLPWLMPFTQRLADRLEARGRRMLQRRRLRSTPTPVRPPVIADRAAADRTVAAGSRSTRLAAGPAPRPKPKVPSAGAQA